MALLGNAAMLLWYDIVPEAVAQHDEWHTREHFPERVGIPGFLRAQRWVSESGSPRYFVVYEVSGIEVLSAPPYMDRLNNPTPWTSRMMPNFRGMTRGFCHIGLRHGTTLGTTAATVRFTPVAGRKTELDAWVRQRLSSLADLPGVSSAFLLQAGTAPQMTKEQSIRGRDAGVDQVLLITGYSRDAVLQLAEAELNAASLAEAGATEDTIVNIHALACQANSQS